MEENKNREEERTEQETKQTKEDIIIEKLNEIQTQNGTIMSALGNIIFIMLNKKNKLNLNNRCVSDLEDCLTTIALGLISIQKNTIMYTEEKMKRRDKEAGDILDMILDLLK